MVATAESVPADDQASSTVQVTQYWDVDYAMRAGEDASELAARLERACQEATSGCVLISSRRRALRRALQGANTLTATLSRPLSGGSLAKKIAEIPQFVSRGVDVVSQTLRGVGVVLAVTKEP